MVSPASAWSGAAGGIWAGGIAWADWRTGGMARPAPGGRGSAAARAIAGAPAAGAAAVPYERPAASTVASSPACNVSPLIAAMCLLARRARAAAAAPSLMIVFTTTCHLSVKVHDTARARLRKSLFAPTSAQRSFTTPAALVLFYTKLPELLPLCCDNEAKKWRPGTERYCAVQPPSIETVVPVIVAAASPQR